MRRQAIDLDVDVLLAPEEGNSHQPILLFDGLASAGPVFWRQYTRFGVELRAGDFTPHGARSDPRLGVVPDTLVFPRIAPSHYIEFAVFFPEPDWRRHGGPGLAEGHEAEVFLSLNLVRNGHGDILRAGDVRGC